MTNSEKATIREVVNMLDPLKRDVTEIKTLLTEHLKNYQIFCNENKEEYKELKNRMYQKISIKAFTAWLTGASVFIGIVLTILKIFKVM